MKPLLALTLAALLCACATTPEYRPVIDTQHVDMNAYERDLAECKALARQRDVGQSAAGGAILGAILGAALGGAIGGSDYVGYGAGVGAVQGTAAGAASGADSQYQIVERCLQGRGYRVLAR
jgi:uncharacterized protein YcfJ